MAKKKLTPPAIGQSFKVTIEEVRAANERIIKNGPPKATRYVTAQDVRAANERIMERDKKF